MNDEFIKLVKEAIIKAFKGNCTGMCSTCRYDKIEGGCLLMDDIPLFKPRVPLFSSDGYADGSLVWDIAECPNCGREFEDCDDTWKCNFCPDCGQPLKWEEE